MAEGETIEIGRVPSLIRYNNPVLLVKFNETDSILKELKPKGQTSNRSTSTNNTTNTAISTTGANLEGKRETEEILNSILPPRCWEENGQYWQQTVSSTPATRQDVINLQEMLETRLQQTQARETGICPHRRELYKQCFDEIIRQVTINCSERGLLLLRIRDEIAMSLEAYETLYCSSVAFGMRKALQAHEEKELLKERVKLLEVEKEILQETISDMKLKNEQNERRNVELRASEEKKYTEEVQFLKKTNAQLKAQLEGITAPKK